MKRIYTECFNFIEAQYNPSGTDIHSDEEALSVYPNPAQDVLKFSFSDKTEAGKKLCDGCFW
jgi:hypothetical protein